MIQHILSRNKHLGNCNLSSEYSIVIIIYLYILCLACSVKYDYINRYTCFFGVISISIELDFIARNLDFLKTLDR